MAEKYLDKIGLAYFWEKIKAYFQSHQASMPEYAVAKLTTAETGFAASYVLKKDNVQVGDTINIPKDYLVKSGEIIEVVEYNGEFYDETDTNHEEPLNVSSAGKYLDFVVNTVGNDGTSSHIYIAVEDLVDVYTQGNGIQISSNNYISVKINGTHANGLGVGGDGISLTLVTPSVNGVGGGNGAMFSTDKEKLDGLGIYKKFDLSYYSVSNGGQSEQKLFSANELPAGVYKVTLLRHISYVGNQISKDQCINVDVTFKRNAENTRTYISGGSYVMKMITHPDDNQYSLGSVVVCLIGFLTLSSATAANDEAMVYVDCADGISLGEDMPLSGINAETVQNQDFILFEKL